MEADLALQDAMHHHKTEGLKHPRGAETVLLSPQVPAAAPLDQPFSLRISTAHQERRLWEAWGVHLRKMGSGPTVNLCLRKSLL